MNVPFIRPADTFSPLVIEGEFGRTVPVTCESCAQETVFKLVSDHIASDEKCDELLGAYLDSQGWTTSLGDICPKCSSPGRR